MKFILDKSKWLRGGTGQLLALSGRMCCLGQLAEQCGAPKHELLNVSTPEGLTRKGILPTSLSWLVIVDRDGAADSLDCQECIGANDGKDTTDEQKIAELRSIFARHGIELEVTEGT